jgi:hypothetical protein
LDSERSWNEKYNALAHHDLPAILLRSRRHAAWPLASSLIVSLAVAATIGLADVVYVLDVAGGDIGGRLLAVLPIYFIAAFIAAQLAFWLLRASVRRLLSASARNAHAVVAGLTFLAAALLHYAESSGVQRVLQEQADSPAAHGGSCPPGVACTALPAGG